MVRAEWVVCLCASCYAGHLAQMQQQGGDRPLLTALQTVRVRTAKEHWQTERSAGHSPFTEALHAYRLPVAGSSARLPVPRDSSSSSSQALHQHGVHGGPPQPTTGELAQQQQQQLQLQQQGRGQRPVELEEQEEQHASSALRWCSGAVLCCPSMC